MTGKFSSEDKKAQCYDNNHISTYSVTCTWGYFNLNEKFQVLSVHFTADAEPEAKGACPVFQKCPSLLSHWLGTGVWQEGGKALFPCQASLPPRSPSCWFWIFQLEDIWHSDTFQNKFTVIIDNQYLTDHPSRPFIFYKQGDWHPKKSKMNSQNKAELKSETRFPNMGLLQETGRHMGTNGPQTGAVTLSDTFPTWRLWPQTHQSGELECSSNGGWTHWAGSRKVG